MQSTCAQCSSGFEIDQRDLDALAKLSPEIGGKLFPLPPPTLCPDCRLQRRLAWRVERTFYFRNCDATGKRILSVFAPDGPYTVFHHEAWYGDSWNALTYGRPYDFSRPFFEQFGALMKEVPLLALNIMGNQNCEYVNQCGWSKNCYMTIEGDYNEDSMYSYCMYFSKNCVDCTQTVRCQQCYECVDCESCFNLRWSQLCKQCSDSSFLFDCRGCSNCFGCAGLRQKKFCVFNQQLSEDQYRTMLQSFDPCEPLHFKAAWDQFRKLTLTLPRRAFIGEQNENVSGNYVYESKDTLDSFNVRGCRDCRYCDLLRDAKDCMDYFVWGAGAERVYDCECCGQQVQNLHFCCECFEGSHDLLYCYQCVQNTADCFGCVGLRHQKYCILNKQYTKEEYQALVPKIIEQMQRDGAAWGGFFPVTLSPFAYNETTAQEYFPLTQKEVTDRKWRYKEALPSPTTPVKAVPVPTTDIMKVPDSIIDEVLECESTQKPFRLTKQELQFYRDNHLPLPRFHPDERHRRRLQLRNPRKLWDRACGKCSKPVKTSYAPDRPEVIVCEECYLKEVY